MIYWSIHLFPLGWSPWPHTMLNIGRWRCKPITEAIWTLGSVSILYYIIYRSTPCFLILPAVSSCATSSTQFSYSMSDAFASISLAPYKSISFWYHHRCETQAPGNQTDRSQRSRISRVTIYCATVFCLRFVYTLISSKPASSIAATSGGYSHPPYPRLCGLLTVIRRATLYWNLPRARCIWGVRTHVSDPKSGKISVFSTWFGLSKFGRLVLVLSGPSHPIRPIWG